MNNKQIDYDVSVTKIIDEWIQLSATNEERYFKYSLSRFVIPDIYSAIRDKIFNIEAFKIEKRFDFSGKLKKIFFSLFWFIKWIYFRAFVKNDGIIICALNLSYKNSPVYLKLLLELAREHNLKIVHFNSSTSLLDLFRGQLYCFPYQLIPIKKNNFPTYYEIETIKSNLNEIVYNNLKIKIDLDGKFNQQITMLNRLYSSFSEMVAQIVLNNKIKLYFNDGDFSSNRVLFNYCCNQINIKTVCTDHAVIFNKHLHLNSFSDYHLAWGNHQLDRIKLYFNKTPGKIFVVGNPEVNSLNMKFSPEGKSIIYFLPSFNSPLFQTINRSLSYSLFIAKKIQYSLSETFPQYKLFIKPHPADKLDELIKKENLNIWSEKVRNTEIVSLCIVEDSSVYYELLNHDTNVLYVKDIEGNDSIGVNNLKSVFAFEKAESFTFVFHEITQNKLDKEERKRLKKHYSQLGFHDNFMNSFQEILLD